MRHGYKSHLDKDQKQETLTTIPESIPTLFLIRGKRLKYFSFLQEFGWNRVSSGVD